MPSLIAPALFVLMWSTGWVVAKFAAPHAGPLTFLTLRYLGALALLAPVAFLVGTRWPRRPSEWGGALVNGMMLHGLYLGGVWWAIAHGVPAGVSALIAALQPLFTVLAAGPLLGERLTPKRWLGVGLGFIGVAAVVAPKLAAANDLSGALVPLGVNVLAMVAVAAAPERQDRQGHSVICATIRTSTARVSDSAARLRSHSAARRGASPSTRRCCTVRSSAAAFAHALRQPSTCPGQ